MGVIVRMETTPMDGRDTSVLVLPPVPAATLYSVDGWLW